MSKAYGLAGLRRVGFLVADPAVVDTVDACAIPFGVDVAGQAAAHAGARPARGGQRDCTVITAEHARVAQELRRRGVGVPDSQANLWWLPAGAAADTLAYELERHGVVTRALTGGVRVHHRHGGARRPLPGRHRRGVRGGDR